MKAIRELMENARQEAFRQGFRLLKPAGIYRGELIIYAIPSFCEPGDVIGLPQGFFADLESGRARYYTAKESMMLSSHEFLDELETISGN